MSTPSSRERSLSAQNQIHLLACSSSSSPRQKGGRSISNSISISISSSAASINSLRDELLTEILIRLPNFPKSAILCKSVCKRWLALIGDPYFTHRLIQRREAAPQPQPQPIGLISQYQSSSEIPNADGFGRSWRKLRTIFWDSEEQAELMLSNYGFISPSLSFLPCYRAELEEKDPIWVLSSFNDLLLCCPREGYHSVYYVCNPITKQWVQLPPRPSQHHWEELEPCTHVGFICEPAGDEVNSKYQFTVVVLYEKNDRFNLDIFSSETGEWRHTMCIPPETVPTPTRSLAACNGMLHWMNSPCNVIALSLEPQGNNNNNNMCHHHSIDPPDEMVPVGGRYGCLGVCQGRLRMSRWQDLNRFMVWELKDNGQSGGTRWSLVHKVDLIEFHSDDPYVALLAKSVAQGKFACLKMVAFHPTDGDVVYLSHRICILLCNMRTRTLRLAETAPLEFDGSMISSMFQRDAFSLVLPLWPTPLPLLPHHRPA